MKESTRGNIFPSVTVVALCSLLFTMGCDAGSTRVSYHDPRLQFFLQAINKEDRVKFGFTPIQTNAAFVIETGSGQTYDSMLHVYQDTSRTISFRKTAAGYRWTGEQEVFQGPRWNQTIDGNFREDIVIEFQIEPVTGIPTNQLWIRYSGPDSDLARDTLTLDEVQPVLDRWKNTAVEPEPPLLPDAGFDPLLFAVATFMLIAALVAAILTLIIGVVGVVVIGGLLLLGIVSTSTITGILFRSASTGFKAFTLQAGAALGLGAGIASCYLVVLFRHTNPLGSFAWLAAAASGMATGLALASLANRICALINRRLRRRRKTDPGQPPFLRG